MEGAFDERGGTEQQPASYRNGLAVSAPKHGNIRAKSRGCEPLPRRTHCFGLPGAAPLPRGGYAKSCRRSRTASPFTRASRRSVRESPSPGRAPGRAKTGEGCRHFPKPMNLEGINTNEVQQAEARPDCRRRLSQAGRRNQAWQPCRPSLCLTVHNVGRHEHGHLCRARETRRCRRRLHLQTPPPADRRRMGGGTVGQALRRARPGHRPADHRGGGSRCRRRGPRGRCRAPGL